MNVAWASVAKTMVRASFRVVTRTAFYTLIGAVVSWTFGFFILDEVRGLWQPSGAAPHHGAPGFIGLLVVIFIVLQNPGPTLLAGLFLVGFPLAWFFLSLRYAIRSTLLALYLRSADHLFAYLAEKLHESTENEEQPVDSREGSVQISSSAAITRSFQRVLKAIPYPLRGMFRHLLRLVDEPAMLTAFRAEATTGKPDVAISAERLAAGVKDQLGERLFAVSLTWLWILLVIEGVCFTAIKILL